MLEYVGQADCTKKKKRKKIKKFYNCFQQEKATLGIGLLNGISSPDPTAQEFAAKNNRRIREWEGGKGGQEV